MMVSDELKEALKKQRANIKAGYALDFVDSVTRAIPHIEALELCRDLLDREHRTINGYEQVPPCSDPDCKIAIALEATP